MAAIAAATLAGLFLGAALPIAEQLRPLVLPLLFLQTTVAVGALAEARAGSTGRWAWGMFVRHHLFASLPLMALGFAMGLDTPLGMGAFVLGAAPTAIALPSNVAACGGRVRPVVQFTLLGYGVGVLATPALLLLAVGTVGHAGPMVYTLLFGLILPATLGLATRRWLQQVPRALSFAIVSSSVLVVMLGMGAALREALTEAVDSPGLLWAALAIGFGRVVWGAGLAFRFPPQDTMHLEAMLAGGGKNAVLAAVIAGASFGPLAALPALVSLFAEVSLLFAVSGFRRRLLSRAPT